MFHFRGVGKDKEKVAQLPPRGRSLVTIVAKANQATDHPRFVPCEAGYDFYRDVVPTNVDPGMTVFWQVILDCPDMLVGIRTGSFGPLFQGSKVCYHVSALH